MVATQDASQEHNATKLYNVIKVAKLWADAMRPKQTQEVDIYGSYTLVVQSPFNGDTLN